MSEASGGGASAPLDDVQAARARLARALRDGRRVPSPAVQAAFASVPRHLFVPGVSPDAAYADEALVIKYDEHGVPVSSSSQPAMMAIMLEQLGLEPGHKVLEIGTGSGYNAAVMASVTGPQGRVVTVDIDEGLIDEARAALAAAGYPQVDARCADGGYGAPDAAPFDRVIVTAGAWDIAPAWLDQLGPGGRLVLPLSVRGIQLSVSLGRAEPPGDARWVATSAFRCGFVRMAGAFADPARYQRMGSSWYAQADGDALLDAEALAEALAGPPAVVGTGLAAGGPDEVSDLDLWLTLTQPGLGRLMVVSLESGGLPPLGGLTGGPGDDVAVALVAGDAEEITVRGYGPGGSGLARRLAGLALDWADAGRPGAATLALSAWLAGPGDPASPGDPAGPGDPVSTAVPPGVPGLRIMTRPHVRLAAGWPS